MKENAHTVYAMGDVWYRQDNPFDYGTQKHKKIGYPTKDTILQLYYQWVSDKIKESGGKFPRGLADLKNRVERQERKVKQVAGETYRETKNMSGGGKVQRQIKISSRPVKIHTLVLLQNGTPKYVEKKDNHYLAWLRGEEWKSFGFGNNFDIN